MEDYEAGYRDLEEEKVKKLWDRAEVNPSSTHKITTPIMDEQPLPAYANIYHIGSDLSDSVNVDISSDSDIAQTKIFKNELAPSSKKNMQRCESYDKIGPSIQILVTKKLAID